MTASRQFSVSSTPIAMNSRMNETVGETIAPCRRPVGRVHVAREPRQDAPGLHLPELRTSGRCSIRSNSDRRSDEHDLRVQQPLAVVPGHADHAGQEDDDEKRRAGQVQACQTGRRCRARYSGGRGR